MLFCSMMHVASGVFAAVLLQVRRKPVRLGCHQNACVFQESPSHKKGYSQNCVRPV